MIHLSRQPDFAALVREIGTLMTVLHADPEPEPASWHSAELASSLLADRGVAAAIDYGMTHCDSAPGDLFRQELRKLSGGHEGGLRHADGLHSYGSLEDMYPGLSATVRGQRLHPALPAAAICPGGWQRPQHALDALWQQLQALRKLRGDPSDLEALHSCGSLDAMHARDLDH